MFARFRQPPENAEEAPYRVFTTRHDREVSGEELDSVLGTLTPSNHAAYEEAWQAFSGELAGWRTRLNLRALDAAETVRATIALEDLAAASVTLLVDQSGSMKGQKMLMAAAAADVAQDFLRGLGCTVEILGFTTSTWKGGRSRKQWLARRSRNPGRLCDLLHIVYRPSEDTRTSSGAHALKPMLRPDLPKENVDGEALEWAVGRLCAQAATRRILVVISDGAPVDDSTLLANDPLILDRHLRAVVRKIEADGRIELAAVGLGTDVLRYYATSARVDTPGDLGGALLGMIEKILLRPAPPTAPHTVFAEPIPR